MSKDNTLLYAGLAVAAVFLVTRKKSATVPVTPYQGAYIAPVNTANSGTSILSSLPGLISNIFNIVKSNQVAASNVSAGYNADGTIQTTNTTQDSINNLSSGSQLTNTLNFPVQTQNQLADNTDDSWLDEYFG